ncbi:MAG TPA: NAD kinase [Saprospiraceae bacterium]|nr:NAD kinase [Saprospiraceae bacterium]
MKILVYTKNIKAEDADIINIFFQELTKGQVTIGLFGELRKDLHSHGIDTIYDFTVGNYEELAYHKPDVIITLGGDGTILGVVTLVKDLGIPIFGINLGRLGFLANIEKSKIIKAVRAIVHNHWTSEERSLLSLESNIPIFDDTPFALNDFTIHKRDTSSMVTIHAYIDNVYLNSYWADGVIVATPTGSTGYSMSCGGPIIFPDSGNWVITPVAPHSLNVRPVVIPNHKSITFKVEGRAENFLCTLDSRHEIITHDHIITLKKCNFNLTLGVLEGMEFMETIREKLMWGLDRRN